MKSKPRFRRNRPRASRCSLALGSLAPIGVAMLATSMLAAPRAADAHTGQYRGPTHELREPFRGQNPRLRPPTGPAEVFGAGGGSTPRRVPPVGPNGQGELRWEFWWEHNKDHYLGLRNHHNRSRSRSVVGGADFLLGGAVKDRVPLVESIDDETRRKEIVPILLSGTRHSDVDVRAACWIALGRVGGEDLEASVFDAGVNDSDADVQKAALLGLGFLGKVEAIPTLAKAMRNPGRELRARVAAVSALALIDGDSARPILESFLQWAVSGAKRDADEIAIAAIRAIGVYGDPRSLEVLHAARKTGAGRETRIEAELWLAIGKLGDPESATELMRALRDRSLAVRRAAAIALGELALYRDEDAELTRLLAHRERWKDDEGVSKEAMAELEALIEREEREGEDARKALARIRDRVVQELLRALDDDNDVQVRNYACISLGKIGTEAARDGLLEAFDSGRSIALQGFAALGLGLLGDPSVSPLLIERLQRAGYVSHRGAVAIALGLLRESAAVPLLGSMVQYKGLDPSLRGYAAQALGLIGDRDVIPDLHRILQAESGNEELLRGVLLGVGMLGDRGSIEPIRRILQDARETHQRTVLGAAVLALGLVRDVAGVQAMIEAIEKPLGRKARVKTRTQAFAAAGLGYIADRSLLPEIHHFAKDQDYRTFVRGIDELLEVL